MIASPLYNPWKYAAVKALSRGHFATIFSVLYALSLFAYCQLGVLRRTAFIAGAILILLFSTIFSLLFKLKLNLRFKEPSLSIPIIHASAFTMALVTYFDSSAPITFGPFLLIVFLLGATHLPTRSLMILASTWLLLYVLIILQHGHVENQSMNHGFDLLQLLPLSIIVIAFIAIGGHIQALRGKLALTRSQLRLYEEKSVRDELTGAYNRRQLKIELEQARRDASLSPVPFSICIIDIDHFKAINDGSGHLTGDKVLRDFVNMAQKTIRSTDVFGRYGGDEFLYILPDTELKGAVMQAERLRVHANFMDFNGAFASDRISLSIGVAQYRSGETIEELIERADAGLYRCKKNGRNRVDWAE